MFVPRLLAHEQHILYYMERVEWTEPEVTTILLRAARLVLHDFDANPMKVPRQILSANNVYYFPVFMLAANRDPQPEGAQGAPNT